MKKIVIKIDLYILNKITEYIKRWIEKRKYEKHKVDFSIHFHWIQLWVLGIFAIVIPVILYLAAGMKWNALVHFIVWTAMAGMHVKYTFWTIKDLKPFHDQLFAMRKNPIYYDMHKQILEEMFVSGRRKRIVMNAFVIFFDIWIGATLIFLSHFGNFPDVNYYLTFYILFSGFSSIVDRYITYVFDFDEPTPKEKKQKDSITDIVKMEWQRIVEGLLPKPNYGI